MNSHGEILRDLRSLGVVANDVLFVHSSLRSMGKIVGGAAVVVAALEQAVAPGGTVLMPSFNLLPRDRHGRAAAWNPLTSPSTTGFLTEYFRLMEGTWRSDHYSHSVAARGADAKWFTADHRSMRGDRSPWDLDPWGRTYGCDSPMSRVYDRSGKLLMLGTDYRTCTYMHMVEVRHYNSRLLKNPEAKWAQLDRVKLGDYWDSHASVRRGRVAHAQSRLLPIRTFVDGILQLATDMPQYCYIDWPEQAAAKK